MKKNKPKFKKGDPVWFILNLNLFHGCFSAYDGKTKNKTCKITHCSNQDITKDEIYDVFPYLVPEQIINLRKI
jgi:hypothetical protein